MDKQDSYQQFVEERKAKLEESRKKDNPFDEDAIKTRIGLQAWVFVEPLLTDLQHQLEEQYKAKKFEQQLHGETKELYRGLQRQLATAIEIIKQADDEYVLHNHFGNPSKDGCLQCKIDAFLREVKP